MFKLPEPIIVTLDNNQVSHINTMAQEIFEDPYRRRRRSLEAVYSHCWAGVPLEFALQAQGATMNPKQFDYSNPDSHNWDVEWNGLKAEVKNSQDPGKLPDKYEKKWLTISNYMANKIVRNRRLYPNCVDIIIFGCYNKLSENTFDVRWPAVVPLIPFAKTFVSVKKNMITIGQLTTMVYDVLNIFTVLKLNRVRYITMMYKWSKHEV